MFGRQEFMRTGSVLAVGAGLVFAVSVILVGIRYANLNARENEKTKLRQLAMAANMAHDTHKTFPPYFGAYAKKETGTFHYHLLPFVENVGLWENPDSNRGVGAFMSPVDPTIANGGAGGANLAVNLRLFYTKGGLGELQTGEKPIYLKIGQITDGSSQTLLFATKYYQCGENGGSLWSDPGGNAIGSPTAATFGASMALWQDAPGQQACDPRKGTAVGFNRGEIMVVFVDSSVHKVSTSVELRAWQALHTPGEQDYTSGGGPPD